MVVRVKCEVEWNPSLSPSEMFAVLTADQFVGRAMMARLNNRSRIALFVKEMQF